MPSLAIVLGKGKEKAEKPSISGLDEETNLGMGKEEEEDTLESCAEELIESIKTGDTEGVIESLKDILSKIKQEQ